MGDLSTLPRAKDWVLVTVIGLLFAGVIAWAAENRRLINKNEDRIMNLERSFYDSMAQRLTRLEGEVGNLQRERDRWKQRKED